MTLKIIDIDDPFFTDKFSAMLLLDRIIVAKDQVDRYYAMIPKETRPLLCPTCGGLGSRFFPTDVHPSLHGHMCDACDGKGALKGSFIEDKHKEKEEK